MEPKNNPINRYTIARRDIMDFVNRLHVEQADYLELAVKQKEAEGFPEAQAVIKNIMELK